MSRKLCQTDGTSFAKTIQSWPPSQATSFRSSTVPAKSVRTFRRRASGIGQLLFLPKGETRRPQERRPLAGGSSGRASGPHQPGHLGLAWHSIPKPAGPRLARIPAAESLLRERYNCELLDDGTPCTATQRRRHCRRYKMKPSQPQSCLLFAIHVHLHLNPRHPRRTASPDLTAR